jgi:Uma2 family endonuclease
MGLAPTISDVVPGTSRRKTRMTFQEFLVKYDGTHTEWVNGEVVPMTPVSEEHARVGVFLLEAVAAYVKVKKLGRVFYEPFVMKTGPDLPGRSPDLIFVSDRNLKRLHKNYLEGPSDLAIEIISPDSRTLDRVTKFKEYQEGGVREYWVIDPERKQNNFYALGPDGLYKPMPLRAGVFRGRVLKGFWIRVAWLWEKPEPSIVDVLREWKLV